MKSTTTTARGRATRKQAARDAAEAMGLVVRQSWTAAQIEERHDRERGRIARICREALGTCERYRSCYFWSNTGSASQRRREEFDTCEAFTWQGREIEVSQSLSISCRNFYFRSHVTRDGQRSTSTVLRNILHHITTTNTTTNNNNNNKGA